MIHLRALNGIALDASQDTPDPLTRGSLPVFVCLPPFGLERLMNRRCLILLPAILVLSHAAAAQDSASPIASGTRVRVLVVDTINQTPRELRYSNPVGRVAGFDHGSLVLRVDTVIGRPAKVADSLRIAVTNIGAVEAFTGMKRHAIQGGVLGLALGAVVGYIVGQPAYGGTYQCWGVAGNEVCGVAGYHASTQVSTGEVFGGAGAAAGAALGYLIRTERWSQLDVGQLRLQVGVR